MSRRGRQTVTIQFKVCTLDVRPHPTLFSQESPLQTLAVVNSNVNSRVAIYGSQGGGCFTAFSDFNDPFVLAQREQLSCPQGFIFRDAHFSNVVKPWMGVMSQYCSLRYLRWFDGWCPVNLRNGRSRAFVRCVWRVSAFHHPRLDFSTTGFTQQFRRRLKQQPIPCFLALRGEGPQIGAGFDALTAPWP